MRRYFHFLLVLGLFCLPAVADTLTVGPGKQYATFCKRTTGAMSAAKDGDTILIDASGDYTDDICVVKLSNLTIRGVNGRPHFKVSPSGPLARGTGIWEIDGNNTLVDNIEFSDTTAHNAEGSGIRFNGVNLIIRNSYFHNNSDGILTSNKIDTGDIVIEYTEFANNGAGDGRSHNIYINHSSSFTLRFCYSHNAIRGHLVKTRALVNYILYNRLSDDDGNGSYELDIPSGGTSYVVGNVIQQSAASENNIILTYLEEAGNPMNHPNPQSNLYVINNTFINDQTVGVFVKVDPAVSASAPAILQNNIFLGAGTITGNVAQRSNLMTMDPSMFVSPGAPNYDYHLNANAAAVGAGTNPTAGENFSLKPIFHYQHASCGQTRPAMSTLDVGAFQYGGTPGAVAAPTRCPQAIPFLENFLNNADFTAGPLAPGSIAAIFGENLASDTGPSSSLPLPLAFDNASIKINGIDAPIFYASPKQLDVQIPYELPPGDALGVVSVNNNPVGALIFRIVNTAPKILLFGAGRAVAQNPDGTLNQAGHPAPIGSNISVYMIGQGAALDQVPPDGQAAPANPPVNFKGSYSATLGGENAAVTFLGLAPNFVGLVQANITVPALAPGDYPLVVTLGGVDSNPALVSVTQ